MFEAEYCNGSDYFIGLTFSVFTPTPNWLAILNHVWTLGIWGLSKIAGNNPRVRWEAREGGVKALCHSAKFVRRLRGCFFLDHIFWDAWVGRRERFFFFENGWFYMIQFRRCSCQGVEQDRTGYQICNAIFRDCLLLCCWGVFHQRTEISSGMFWVSVILSHVFDTEVTTLMHRFPIQTCWGKERPPGCNLKKLFSKIKGLKGLRSFFIQLFDPSKIARHQELT